MGLTLAVEKKGDERKMQRKKRTRLTVNCSQGRVRAGIISLPDVAARRGSKKRSSALVTGDLCCDGFTSGEFEDVTGVRFEVEVTVKPPLVEGVVCERSDRPVVIRESLIGNVESIHARVEE